MVNIAAQFSETAKLRGEDWTRETSRSRSVHLPTLRNSRNESDLDKCERSCAAKFDTLTVYRDAILRVKVRQERLAVGAA
eukprot:1196064-Prorocentrum_minimum.AAC.3